MKVCTSIGSSYTSNCLLHPSGMNGLEFIVNKMEKQDLQAEESWWQNSSYTTIKSRSKKQKKTDIWIDEDGFKPGSRLDWKIVETF